MRDGPPRRLQNERRGMDFSLGPVRDRSAPNQSSSLRLDGPDPGGDWRAAVLAWVRQRAYYPPRAAENDEEGPVTIRMVVLRDGTIQSAVMERRSISTTLNLTTLMLFQGNRLPPFPPGNHDPSTTLSFTINYVLIRR
ncbi:TonB family protein [Roseomonas sp. NAR14]|uniref:TonB family protein n=1 Tax=Roseomonas acroporae TaxID=2937791 RepID=A0A9X1Y7J1_9PROT|nr:TonB family protein [Roseomonas acroporae]MCK8784585.1 TonB family protein [Roseomonas acroporae]